MAVSAADEFKYDYKFSFFAHEQDVRVIKSGVFRDGECLVTGSRDSCVKFWVQSQEEYTDRYTFIAGDRYVFTLCILPASAQYPDGLILAGSQDSCIYGFTLGSHEPVFRLHGHSDTVCSLSAGNFDTIVSGSWDQTAKVWSGQQCKLTLIGHQAAVWATAVFHTQNLILTGSADKTIRLWQSTVCERVFYGHEDCVRDLAIKSETEFLSCSNDSSVRLWKTSGECLQTYRGHSNFVYSITLLNGTGDFASCGEDQTLNIWKNGHFDQAIPLPCQSLWSVTCLSNGDLAVAGSDGVVYVFGKVSLEKYNEGPKHLGIVPFSKEEREDTLRVVKKRKDSSSENLEAGPSSVRSDKPIFDCTHMPATNYFVFFAGNLQGLKRKLAELNSVVHPDYRVDPESIDMIVPLADVSKEDVVITGKHIDIVDTLIMWEDECIFPALDWLRLATCRPEVCSRMSHAGFFVHLLKKFKEAPSFVNKLLIIKIFCNLFRHDGAQKSLLAFSEEICHSVQEAVSKSDDLQKAGAALFLNYAVKAYKGAELNCDCYCLCLCSLLNDLNDKEAVDAEAIYRALVAVGTLCYANQNAASQFVSLNVFNIFDRIRATVKDDKVIEALNDLVTIFQQL